MNAKGGSKPFGKRALVAASLAAIFGHTPAQGVVDASAVAGAGFFTQGLANAQVKDGDGWVSEQIFDGDMNSIVISDGRGDGTVRLYATEFSTNTVKEFVYAGSWTNS